MSDTDTTLLLAQLRGAGLTLRIGEDGRLVVAPAERITAEQRQALRQHRDILLELLRQEEEADAFPFDRVPSPQECHDGWTTPWPPLPYPTLGECLAAAPLPGRAGCGDRESGAGAASPGRPPRPSAGASASPGIPGLWPDSPNATSPGRSSH